MERSWTPGRSLSQTSFNLKVEGYVFHPKKIQYFQPYPTIWFALRHNINLQRVNMVAISGLSLDFVTLDNEFGVSHLFSCTINVKLKNHTKTRKMKTLTKTKKKGGVR
jgi:hypothetical protein